MSLNACELLSSRRISVLKRVPRSFCKLFESSRFGVCDEKKCMIPTDFYLVNNRGRLPLTVRLYNTNDFYWSVDVELGDDDCFYLADGWRKFVVANKLRSLDYLTFTAIGDDIYLVDVYGTNGCLRFDVFRGNKRLLKDGRVMDVKELEEVVDAAVDAAVDVVVNRNEESMAT